MKTYRRLQKRLLTINPDDIQVLQEQILLVIDSDPERVFRNKKRLESLGIETEFDSQNKTELSEIVERANEIGRQINPFGKPKNAEELIKKASKLLLLSEINTALECVEMALKLDPNNGKSIG